MDPSNAQHQVMSNQTLETLIVSSKQTHQDQKKPRPQPEEVIKCPRCESTNTKFCYYNNYSLSQPRYFCKSCRRYWTKGGTLRNVPVGGGYRKNKRSNSSSRNKINHEEPLICVPNSNPLMGYDPIDLSLAFAKLQRHPPSSSAGNLGFGGEISIFGNSGGIGGNSSLENSIGNGGLYLGTNQNGNFSNLCYGFMGDHHQNSTAMSREMAMPYEEIKREMCINGNGNSDFRRDENESAENPNKFLWGFPWQVNSGETGMGNSDMDSRRESWNGFSSSWHGLLNSPLM